jgi:hypothetical protein
VDKVLIDTSTFFDIGRAAKNPMALWAQNTIHKLAQYQAHYPRLTVSAFTTFEHLDGLYRQGKKAEASEFMVKVLPSLKCSILESQPLPSRQKFTPRLLGQARLSGWRTLLSLPRLSLKSWHWSMQTQSIFHAFNPLGFESTLKIGETPDSDGLLKGVSRLRYTHGP